MATIVLLRHGQASFGSDNYDQLSELGQRQAVWLGEHWRRLGDSPDHILMGEMARHRQTAEGVLRGLGESGREIARHPGLDEYDFLGLLQQLRRRTPERWVDTGERRRDYYHNLRHAIDDWMAGRIADDGRDSWASFRERVLAGFEQALHSGARRCLVVSSGGPIAVVLQSVLRLDDARTRDITLQIKNASCSQLLHNRREVALDSFNDVGHLTGEDKPGAITFA